MILLFSSEESFSRTAKKQILLTSLPDGVILLAAGDRTIGS